MKQHLKLIAATLFLVVGLTLPVWAAYKINSSQYMPPSGVSPNVITTADRVLASAPIHDLGAAVKAWISVKIKMKNVSGTVASVVFNVNACTVSTCGTANGAVSQVINTGYVTLASGTYFLQGFIDDPGEFVQIQALTTGAPTILFDSELSWIRL